MARKIQQLSIDGVNVDLSKARFAETFDVAEGDERQLAFDEDVVYVVVARVSTPSFRESRKGEVSRVNVLKVKEARLLKNEDFKTRVLDYAGFDYRPQPSLFDGLEDPEEVVVNEQQSIAELEESGVRFVNEPDPEEVPVEAYEGDGEAEGPQDEIDEQMATFLAITKKLNDEYEYADDLPDDPERNIVADARGLRATDPVLDRFLESAG